jgi:hypothetical protein
MENREISIYRAGFLLTLWYQRLPSVPQPYIVQPPEVGAECVS